MRHKRAGDAMTSPRTNIHHWEKYIQALMRITWQPVRITYFCPASPNPRLSESETLGVGPSDLCFKHSDEG